MGIVTQWNEQMLNIRPFFLENFHVPLTKALTVVLC